MMATVLDWVIAGLIVTGALFGLVGSIGLARLQDFYQRLHGPSKSSTLGVGAVLIASMLYFSFVAGKPTAQELLITLFLFLTAPISAHLLVKAALKLRPQTRPTEPQGRDPR